MSLAKVSTETDQLDELRKENSQLKKDCQELKKTQDTMETVIAESNKKQLLAEISSMELEHIFSSVTDAIWVIRDDGIVVRANNAMFELLEKPLEEVIGQNCCELLDYDLCHQKDCPLNICKTHQKREFDIVIRRGDKKEHFILNAAPMKTIIGTTAIICQFKNITFRKAAEQKLEEANRLLSQMARMDGLTQIANRRFFDERLEQEWQRLSRSDKPLSLILMDIDFFKKYNDRYGHQAGDDCLIQVAQVLRDCTFRPGDLAARYGGEEFVILLPETDLPGAIHVGKRILDMISSLKIPHEGSNISAFVTLSLGAATVSPETKYNAADLVKKADTALYEAKMKGRAQLVIASPENLLSTCKG